MIKWVVLAAFICFYLVLSPSFGTSYDAVLGVGTGKNILYHKQFERLGALGVRFGSNTLKLQSNVGYWFAPQPLASVAYREIQNDS